MFKFQVLNRLEKNNVMGKTKNNQNEKPSRPNENFKTQERVCYKQKQFYSK